MNKSCKKKILSLINLLLILALAAVISACGGSQGGDEGGGGTTTTVSSLDLAADPTTIATKSSDSSTITINALDSG
ncbi:MAG TPA: hypothetical protein P5040_06325, partial [Smithella sp.]|nr:hypothetical protein [Smithella sp.]